MNRKFTVILILLVIGIIGVLLVTGVINPTVKWEKTKISTYYMYPGENKLVIKESSEKSRGKEMVKIFFNDKDYTRFAEKLLASQPLCFASCRLLGSLEGKKWYLRINNGSAKKASCLYRTRKRYWLSMHPGFLSMKTRKSLT